MKLTSFLETSVHMNLLGIEKKSLSSKYIFFTFGDLLLYIYEIANIYERYKSYL